MFIQIYQSGKIVGNIDNEVLAKSMYSDFIILLLLCIPSLRHNHQMYPKAKTINLKSSIHSL